MITLNIIPWENYGLIAELAHRLKNKRLQFSKIVLQDLIFLLQELFGINCGYRFDFYIYGPYCSDIEIDLSLVESWGGVKVYPVASHHNILPGKNNRSIRGLLTDHKKKDALDSLIKGFGGLSTKELELMSTIVYVAKGDVSKGKLLDIVKSLRPGFSDTEIIDAITSLQDKKFFQIKEL